MSNMSDIAHKLIESIQELMILLDEEEKISHLSDRANFSQHKTKREKLFVQVETYLDELQSSADAFDHQNKEKLGILLNGLTDKLNLNKKINNINLIVNSKLIESIININSEMTDLRRYDNNGKANVNEACKAIITMNGVF